MHPDQLRRLLLHAVVEFAFQGADAQGQRLDVGDELSGDTGGHPRRLGGEQGPFQSVDMTSRHSDS